jgi:hypothetical protein
MYMRLHAACKAYDMLCGMLLQVEVAEVVSTGAKVVIKSCSASSELQREVASFQRLGRHPLLVPLLAVFEEVGGGSCTL